MTADDCRPPAAARALLDQEFATDTAPYIVDQAGIAQLVEALQEGNPAYWDTAFAQRELGGLRAPPTLALAPLGPRRWRPEEGGEPAPMVKLNIRTKDALGMLVAIVQRSEIAWERPIRIGDRLTAHEILREISDRKDTRLGPGYFFVIETLIRDQTGATVATIRQSLFAYGQRRARAQDGQGDFGNDDHQPSVHHARPVSRSARRGPAAAEPGFSGARCHTERARRS